MRQLHFDYYMGISYEREISRCHYTLKCIPADNEKQHLLDYSIEILPEHTWSTGRDSFGNAMIYGDIEKEQSSFSFHINGNVEIEKAAQEAVANPAMARVYAYPSNFTMPGEELKKFYNKLNEELSSNISAYDRGVFFMHTLYGNFIYEKGVTDVSTTAEEAWKLGKGVCQDYAHILTVLCRLDQIPARYVSGMLVGEGYSHAWVEILVDGKWYGLDPTNDVVVEDSHIKIGVGRDASDCQINRGIVLGGGNQTQDIKVCVE